MPKPTTNSSGIANPTHSTGTSTSRRDGLSKRVQIAIERGSRSFKISRTLFNVKPVSIISSTINTSLP